MSCLWSEPKGEIFLLLLFKNYFYLSQTGSTLFLLAFLLFVNLRTLWMTDWNRIVEYHLFWSGSLNIRKRAGKTAIQILGLNCSHLVRI